MFEAPALVRSESQWTPRLRARAHAHTGRKAGQTTGTYLDNLIECRKVITLCPSAAGKFQAARKGYIVKRSMPRARARCDATGVFALCTVFFPRENV